MITKKLSKTTWAFDPTALDGKGYWFVYGKNGALGRAATQEEARQLGTPSKDEIYPQDDAEKVKSEEPEDEEMYGPDLLKRNQKSRYYGKITQTRSKYEQANIVRGDSFGKIVSERMLRGEGGREALKGAAGEKIGAIGMGIKEKFDPIRLLNKLPIFGGALATMYGMKQAKGLKGKKREQKLDDISYFTGAGRYMPQQPIPGLMGRQAGDEDSGLASKVTTSVSQRMGTATKVGREMASGVPQKNINNIKTVLGAMKKLYALERIWYDEEKKNRAEDKKEKEIAANFKEEQEMERQRELLKALTGKDTKLGKKEKPKKEESKGFFGWLKDMFDNFLGFKLIDGILSIMKTGIMGMLRGAATLLAPVLGLLGEAIIPVIAVIGTLALAMKGLDWLISKFTGKPMDYLEKKYDKETTPDDVQKDFDKVQGGMNGPGITDKQYENNKKTLASDKPVAGFQNGKWVKDVRPELQKQNDSYDSVQKFKGSNDPFQTYRREVEAGHVKRETSFEDWKKEQGNTGALDAEGKPLTRNLRNNNPGNIRANTEFAEKHGATGVDEKGFAIFPTMDAGEQAQKDLLFKSDSKDKSQSYKNLTLDKAIEKYAPPSENNPSNYKKVVKSELGKSYDPNKKMSEYSPEDQQKIMTGFQKMEGGTVEGYKLAQQNNSKLAQQNKPTATKLTESYQAKLSGVTQDQIEKNPNYKKYLAQAKEMGDTQDEAEDYATELVYADMAKSANKLAPSANKLDSSANKLAPVNKLTPVAKADELSNRMNNSVSENKNLTSMTNQPQVTPPIMMNTTNNIMNKGGNSASIAPTPIRNDEPMLLRSQYGVIRTV